VAALVLVGASLSGACRAADAVKGEAMFSTAGGYARLILKLARDVPSDVTTAGSILVIRFAQPVDIPVDRLPELCARLRQFPRGATPMVRRSGCRWRAA